MFKSTTLPPIWHSPKRNVGYQGIRCLRHEVNDLRFPCLRGVIAWALCGFLIYRNLFRCLLALNRCRSIMPHISQKLLTGGFSMDEPEPNAADRRFSQRENHMRTKVRHLLVLALVSTA